jgi:hypothetical protein
MAVTIDATATTTYDDAGTTVSPQNYTGMTVGAGLTNSALLIIVLIDAGGTAWPTGYGTAPTAKWAAQTMTLIGRAVDSTNHEAIEYWGVLSPTAGNQTFAYTWPNAGGANNVAKTMSAVSFKGVTQTSIAAAFANFHSAGGTANGASQTQTSATGNIAVATFSNDSSGGGDPMTAPAGAVEWSHGGPNVNAWVMSYASGAASVTFTTSAFGSSVVYAAAGVNVVAAPDTLMGAMVM